MWESSLARDVMMTGLITVQPDALVLDGMELLLQNGISGAPVVDGERYIGVFSEESCWRVLVQMSQASPRSRQQFQHSTAADIMATDLIVFSPATDTLKATDELIHHRISGGPVVDHEVEWLGSFSEHSAMKALLDIAMHQTPPGTVSSCMDSDPAQIVTPDTRLEQIIEQFRETKYRRFPVVKDGRLVGQISRRDVLRTALRCLDDPEETEPGAPRRSRDTIGLPPSGQPMLVQDVYSAAAATIAEDFDLLKIVRLFHDTSARRLPVIQDSRIVGQVSRRDLLQTAIRIFPDDSNVKTSSPRYLRTGGGSYPLPD